MKDTNDRAKELHEEIKDEFKRRKITIAVGNTTENIALVGTSERYMQSDILKALEEHEIVATPQVGKHAEEDILDEAQRRELTIETMGASRPICLDCEQLLVDKQIESKTPFSGKKSRNRREQ